MASCPAPPPRIVIDTNVVMDWLVFRNRACDPVVAAIEAGRVQWVCTQEMRQELEHVLGRGVAMAYAPDVAHIGAAWDRWALTVPAPPATLVPRVRCTDRDDQKFIDLALGEARWLLTRDRAVLKLARKAAACGTVFITPERWTLS